MKSVFRFFLSLFLLVLLVLPAAAGEYQLGDTGFAAAIPDELLVITPDVSDDSPALDLLGFTRAQALKLLSDGDYCLLAFPSDLSFELNISTMKSAEKPFESLSKEELEDLLLSGKESLSESGLDVSSGKVLYPGGRPFLVLLCHRFSSSGEKVDVFLCQTSLGTDLVTFSLHCYEGDITKEHTDLVHSVLKSIAPCSEESTPTAPEGPDDSEGGNDTGYPASRRDAVLTLLFYLLGLTLSAALCVLPVCIYRFVILKKPVLFLPKAKKISIVCALLCVLVLALFSSFIPFSFPYPGVIPAALINYRILAGPKKKHLQSPPPSAGGDFPDDL